MFQVAPEPKQKQTTPQGVAPAHAARNPAAGRPATAFGNAQSSSLALRRALGNRAIGRILQTELESDQPGAIDEKEADRVGGHAAEQTVPAGDDDKPRGQRGGKASELALERSEVGSVATRMQPLRRPSSANIIQRKCSCAGPSDQPCEACKKKTETEVLQRSETRGENSSPARGVIQNPEQIRARLGTGTPLAPPVRKRMEEQFGQSFENVRIHSDPAAHETATGLSARAFTLGSDIAFRSGEYNPGSAAGTRLLAHELAHVVQQGREQPSAIMRSYAAFEAEADHAADSVAASRQSPPLTTAGTLMLQAEDLLPADATGLEDLPLAQMTADFTGLTFYPPANAKLTPKTSWKRQVVGTAIKRLVGETQYVPGKLEDTAISRFNLTIQGRMGNADEEAKARDQKKESKFELFVFSGQPAIGLLAWLESGEAGGKKYDLDILPAQREVVEIGLTLDELWKVVSQQSTDAGGLLPAWYTNAIFRSDAANFGDLLRAFRKAKTDDDKSIAAAPVLDAILPSTDAMEAIRKDPALFANWEYRLLWFTELVPNSGKPDPKKVKKAEMAAPGQKVGAPASAMLGFIRTQQPLMEAAVSGNAEGKEARLELLTRFGRFFTSAPVFFRGDLLLAAAPSRFNTEPFPGTLSSYPPVGPPIFDLPIRTEYSFIMDLQVKDFFEAWATLSYHYSFEKIKIPPGRFLNTATGSEKGEIASKWSAYKDRISRDNRYNAADLLRITRNIHGMFGDPGVVVQLATLSALLRYAGTTLQTLSQLIFEPRYVASMAFQDEGLYMVRATAWADTPEAAEVKRPASVAYMTVFAEDPELLAEERLQLQVEAEERDRRRLAEIKSLLLDPNVPHRQDLLEEKARIEQQLTVEGSLKLSEDQVNKSLQDPSLSEDEKKQLKDRLEKVQEIETMRTKRGLNTATNAERVPAVFVGDDGKTINLVLEAIDKTPPTPDPDESIYYVSDETTPDSGDSTCDYTLSAADKAAKRTAKSMAVQCAVKQILEGTMGYGRGYVSLLVDGRAASVRIEADESQILLEGLSNLATVAAVAAIAAAPFTGGASLELLIPIGIIGAIPSAYRIAARAEAGNLRWDLATATDLVNIVAAFTGLGAEAALAKRATLTAGALLITGFGANGLNVVLMGAQLMQQINQLKELPPALRQAKLAEILEGALVNAGILIAGSLVAHYRTAEGAGFREKSLTEWQESLSPFTRELLKGDSELSARFTEMSARVREILTHCSDYCIPTAATREHSRRIEALLEKFKVTPDEERALKIFFHDEVQYDDANRTEQRKRIESTIDQLEALDDAKAFRQFLGKEVSISDRVLGLFPRLRERPDLQKLAEKLVDPKRGGISVRLLGDILDQAKARGGAERLLGYLDKLTSKPPGQRPVNYEAVLADLTKGYNFYTGAEWVLRWIDLTDSWNRVREFEVLEIDESGTRRWDANIGGALFQFKSWSDFWKNTFLKQISQDYEKTGGFADRKVRWVFDLKGNIEDLQEVKDAMIDALTAARDAGDPRFPARKVARIIASLDNIVTVGANP